MAAPRTPRLAALATLGCAAGAALSATVAACSAPPGAQRVTSSARPSASGEAATGVQLVLDAGGVELLDASLRLPVIEPPRVPDR